MRGSKTDAVGRLGRRRAKEGSYRDRASGVDAALDPEQEPLDFGAAEVCGEERKRGATAKSDLRPFEPITRSHLVLEHLARYCAEPRLLYAACGTSRSGNRGAKAQAVSGERTKKAAVTRALEEFIARRRQKRLLELIGKLEWDDTLDYKTERSRR
jgi:hypothetical protein